MLQKAFSAAWSPENSHISLICPASIRIRSTPSMDKLRPGLEATKWRFAVTISPFAITEPTLSTRNDSLLNSVNFPRCGKTSPLSQRTVPSSPSRDPRRGLRNVRRHPVQRWCETSDMDQNVPLGPLADGRWSEADHVPPKTPSLWCRGNVGEVFPNVMTPMSSSL